MRFVTVPAGQTATERRIWGIAIVWCPPGNAPTNPSTVQFDGAEVSEIRSYWQRRPDGIRYWSEVRIRNTADSTMVVAVTDEQNGELPPVAPLGAVTLVDRTGRPLTVDTDSYGLTVSPYDRAGLAHETVASPDDATLGRQVVQVRGSQNASLQQDSGDNSLIVGGNDRALRQDGNGNLIAALVDADGNPIATEENGTSNILRVRPRTVVETLASGGVDVASGSDAPVDVKAYSALVLTCTGLNLSAGTAQLGIEMLEVGGAVSLYTFQHSAAVSTGAVSIQVGRGLTNTNLDTRNATFGARPLCVRVAWTIAGGPPAAATGSYILYGIRGEG